MSDYAEFKRLLIKSWPSFTAISTAYAVYGSSDREQPPTVRKCIDMVKSFKMPEYLKLSVSRYIAMFYPNTSKALYDGIDKDICLKIFMKEKKRKNMLDNDHPTMDNELAKERRHHRQTMTIKARSLDKRHDWNTVK